MVLAHGDVGDAGRTGADVAAAPVAQLPGLAAGGGPLLGRFLSIFTDFSDFIGRLHPRQTRLQKPPNTLGVE